MRLDIQNAQCARLKWVVGKVLGAELFSKAQLRTKSMGV
jgi:hypothetical protein